MYKKKMLLVATAIATLSYGNLTAQSNQSLGLVSGSIGSPAVLPSEIFRFRSGFISQFENGTFGGVGANDRWFALGQTTIPFASYGLRLQKNGDGISLDADNSLARISNHGTGDFQIGRTATTTFKPLLSFPNSQVEVARFSKGLITQLRDGTVGNFSPANNWTSMGNFDAASQVLNGFRAQSEGRALVLGHRFINGSTASASNPFLEWIGSSGLTPGNLEFKYAFDPLSTNRIDAFKIVPNATTFSANAGANAYANKGLIGALQTGSFGNVTPGNSWVAIGQAPVFGGAVALIGNRIQNDGYAFLTSVRENAAGVKKAYVDFGGNAALANIADFDLVFRSFAADDDFNNTRNSMSIKRNGNILLASEQGLSSPGVFSFYNPKVEINTRNILNSTGEVHQLGLGVTTENYLAIEVKTINAGGIRSTASGNEMNSNLEGVTGIADGAKNENFGLRGFANGAYNGVDFKNNYGVSGEASNGGGATGIRGAASGAEFANYGIFAEGIGSPSFPGSWNLAGFFNGDIVGTGNGYFFSDKKVKDNILTEADALTIISKLNPISYNFKSKEFDYLQLSKVKSHGFIAQEVETVLPELVKEVGFPKVSKDGKTSTYETYKAVNYVGLISVLTKAIQELNTKVETLQKQLTAKTSETFVLQNNATESEKQIVKANAFSLSQNAPNPFSEKTTITYTIPNNVKKAMLGVFDLNGKMLLQYNLQTGKNQLIVNGNTLSAGMYLYTLIADGEEVLSKRMILTR